MTIQAGDNTIDGKVVTVTLDPNGNVVTVVFPTITDTFGTPLTITFSPALIPEDAEEAIDAILSRLG